MNRLFGLMPNNETVIERTFIDQNNLTVMIQAGPNGWSIIYSDYSSKYNDEKSTTEENFNKAFKIAEDDLGTLTEVKYETNNEEK